MNNESDQKSTAVPLIVGVLAALTVGFWLFHDGGKSEQKAAASKPPASSHE